MGAFTTKFELKGTGELLRSLDLSKKNVRKAIRKGITKAGNLIRRAAKANLRSQRRDLLQSRNQLHEVSKSGKEREIAAARHNELLGRTGLLEKSLAVKVTIKGKRVFAVVGPARGFREQVGTRKRSGAKSNAGDPVFEDPANIAHLVEYGHLGPHPAPPHPFLRPAYEETKDAAQEAVADAVGQGLVEGIRG